MSAALRIRVRGARTATLAVLAALGLGGCAVGGASATGGTDPAASCGPSVVRTGQAIEPVEPAPTPKLPVTVESADGRPVTVRSADRILAVNMYGSIAEIVFSLGLGDRVVGRDASTTFEAAADLPLVTTNGHDLSAEAVLRLDPTVVLLDAGIGPAGAVDQLRDSGIPVVLIGDQQTLPAIGEHITEVAAALGVPEAGRALKEQVGEQIDAARAESAAGAEPLRIAFLYLRGTAGVYLIGGRGAGSDALIEAIGATDAGAAAGLAGFRPLTSEGMINAAPDVILVLTGGLESVGGVDGLVRLPGVGQTPAGRNRRIVSADDGALLTFGPRTGKTIRALAEAVHRPCGAR
ncbi:iron complex transport system substrate-binding protein [Thermomonospora echinospora]|uniref:Iron complex transport system substrate-binding protein n=1 Tax=Thermomonospora echinospora TaxID=1992 RepID=A0A1H6CT97_9ACTN|nr:ABC transporter substrate-binding protein [Thermomonospora echinospora]SEG76164.1 iron complex transport system substrate-binding protein [Thermomonospora echinospora]